MELAVCGEDLKESGDNTWCHVSGERKGQRRWIGGGFGVGRASTFSDPYRTGPRQLFYDET